MPRARAEDELRLTIQCKRSPPSSALTTRAHRSPSRNHAHAMSPACAAPFAHTSARFAVRARAHVGMVDGVARLNRPRGQRGDGHLQRVERLSVVAIRAARLRRRPKAGEMHARSRAAQRGMGLAGKLAAEPPARTCLWMARDRGPTPRSTSCQYRTRNTGNGTPRSVRVHNRPTHGTARPRQCRRFAASDAHTTCNTERSHPTPPRRGPSASASAARARAAVASRSVR
jgi:hypothetical protein